MTQSDRVPVEAVKLMSIEHPELMDGVKNRAVAALATLIRGMDTAELVATLNELGITSIRDIPAIARLSRWDAE